MNSICFTRPKGSGGDEGEGFAVGLVDFFFFAIWSILTILLCSTNKTITCRRKPD